MNINFFLRSLLIPGFLILETSNYIPVLIKNMKVKITKMTNAGSNIWFLYKSTFFKFSRVYLTHNEL